ncbi:Peptidoglycan D,D-transpeptidase FtsI [invertebrate metagenome]|uniref:Peptidoglycan D,D-transpeptidase FtsI n=1 Tax=invertebrate metagenome TaxID=1711999 RepID=A0A2H9TAT4_9ZZZZ
MGTSAQRTRKKHQKAVFYRRLIFLRLCFVVASVILGYRILDLQLFNRQFLQNEGDKRSVRYESIPAHRGIIFDRNGKPLSVSTPLVTLWADPGDLYPESSRWQELANALNVDYDWLSERITVNKHKEFVYLKRQMAPEVANKVMALDIPGVHSVEEHRRYYPAGEVASHLVGFVDIDEVGQEGVELAYNRWLSGDEGKVRYLKDRRGRLVKKAELIDSPKVGKELRLSIDLRLQYLAYKALKSAVREHKAKSGSLVMLDSQTGEVLAMVNQPSYNPNSRSGMKPSRMRNRVVTDAIEPGSTLKPFTIAAALESGRYNKNTPINTSPGWMMLGRNEVRDILNYGQLTVTSVLTKSSNIGVTKIAMDIGVDSILDVFTRVGLGQSTGIGFPGENTGYLPFRDQWSRIGVATLSFGYGLTVTPLQLAQAYMVLATGGIMRPVSVIKRDIVPKGHRVLEEQTALDVRNMLATVVQSGSARRAKVAGYKVGGKTGTVRKIENGGYSSDRHMGLFAGIAPLDNPRLVTVVVIDDPADGHYYGGLTAAPVFSKVTASALRMLRIPPDKQDILTVQRTDKRHDDAG